MILDYNFSSKKQQLTISYIKENGAKGLLKYDVSRFKTFYEDPNGKFTNWNGNKCDIKWTNKPHKFDIKTFIKELPKEDRDKLTAKYTPKNYSVDIEVECGDEFPEPSEAKFPIYTISVVNDNMECVVMGTKSINNEEEQWISDEYYNYLQQSEFFNRLNLHPRVKYLSFESEEMMLTYFLKNIVAKAPIMFGWNFTGFDWLYITNRIRLHYKNIPLPICSCDWNMSQERHMDFRNKYYNLSVPCHTLVIDMMDVINTDFVVMPIKESLSLDYIGSESPVKLSKVKYDGNLEALYRSDYKRYVFYNCIDSAIVMLIDKCFGTLKNFEMQALFAEEKIKDAFSRIASTESLFWNYWYDRGIKIVPPEKFVGDRGELMGAYVKTPTPGKHNYVCCNDFASLYPSSVMCCNLSIENYIGSILDGQFTEEQLEEYRKDKNYFVTVMGSVYKNDKDYAFKDIQSSLKLARNKSKYLSKKLDAVVMLDVEHFEKAESMSQDPYTDDLVQALESIGYQGIKCSSDIKNIQDLELFKRKLDFEIHYLAAMEQAIKILMNSMYGGTSHVAFAWFNIRLANDITGESRNLIHIMEKHIPEWFQNNWLSAMELHKSLNVKIDPNYQLGEKLLVEPVYGDTDSIYSSYAELIKTIKGHETWDDVKIAHFIVDLSLNFLNDHNKEVMKQHYFARHARSMPHEFELETLNKSGVWLNVKKRYAQVLLWKDGKYFDQDELPLKVKGLEMIKSSYPKIARNTLKMLTRTLLENDGPSLIHKLNMEMQKSISVFNNASIEDVCPTSSVNNYDKFVVNDEDPNNLILQRGTPFVVRATALHNSYIKKYNYKGNLSYGGKHRWYVIKDKNSRKSVDNYFAYEPGLYPEWAAKTYPIDRKAMFERMILSPFNRILEPIGLPVLQYEGSIQTDLFA